MCVFYVREDIIPMYTLSLHGIYALNGASFKITSWSSYWPQDVVPRLGFHFYSRCEIVQSPDQQRCRDAWKIKQRYNDHDTQSGACTLQEIWW